MPASNIFGAIQKGLAFADQQERNQQNQAFNLEQQEFQRGQQFLQLDDQRKKALFTDAREVNTRLGAGDVQGALGVLSERLGIQFLIVSHAPELVDAADVVHEVQLDGTVETIKQGNEERT